MTCKTKEGINPLSNTPNRRLFTLAMVLLGGLAATPIAAQKTNSFEIDTISDFMRGDITTSTLTWDGRVAPPIQRELLAPLDAEVAWDVVEHGDRRFIATGHSGKLFVEDGSGEATVLHEFEEPSIYSLLATADGRILAATSPGGIIHDVDPSTGETSVVSQTGAATIWDMIEYRDQLAIATGPKGKILTVDDSGTTATLVQFPDTLNVLDITLIPGTEDLAVATQGPGILARVSPDGSWRVIIDPEQDEIRRVAVLEDGSIVAAVNGVRSPGERLLQPAGESGRPGGNAKPQPESFIVRAHPNGFVEEWWTSPEAPIHDIALGVNGTLLVTAGARGLFYEVTPTGDTNVRGVADQEFLTRLAPGADGSILVATGADASLMRIHPGKFGEGIYESEVLDGKATVNWTRIRGIVNAADGDISISTRSGNTAKPNETWSDWTDPIEFPGVGEHASHGEHLVQSPVARFLQFRLEMTAAPEADTPPTVDFLRVFHTRPNAAPVVRDISIQSSANSGGSSAGASRSPQQAGRPGGDPAGASRGGTPSPSPEVAITWSAQDPDGDDLLFDVFLRAVGETHWLSLEEDLDAPRLSLSLREIPDGEYRVKVVASDSPSNPSDLVLTGSRESGVFTLDTTPPAILIRDASRNGDEATISVRVEDSVSLIRSARWRVGFGDWNIIFPDDGAFDSRSETFTFTVEDSALNQPGMFVMFSATDGAGNIATTRIDLD